MDELKPCPNCGVGDDVWIEGDFDWASIACHKCGIETKQKPTIDEAIVAWNTRT